MPSPSQSPIVLSVALARRIWLEAQRLGPAHLGPAHFGAGADAVRAVVKHLGYVQIDTINVVERCHHHILWTRLPDYRRAHLHDAQSVDRSVFEYWTHALSYVASEDFRFALPDMARHRQAPKGWFAAVTKEDVGRLLKRIRDDGPLTIRDIDDDVLVEKDHAWASRKPSKRALQLAFYTGALTISRRSGMLKTYELTPRHFGWATPPRPPSERQTLDYILDRALRSQGLVSLSSICHLDAGRKPAIRHLIDARLRRKQLRAILVAGSDVEHWARPSVLDCDVTAIDGAVHILSPFDPLIIQRKRLRLFFGYDHRFEAYVPKEKRVFGYFALPVLVGDEIVASLDIKTDREKRVLSIRQWNWVGHGSASLHKAAIEDALHRFERFQLAP